MRPSTLKGLIHAGLALVAVGELYTATSRTRKVLLGAMAGFHAHATLYHFVYERGEEHEQTSRSNSQDQGQ